MKNIKAKIVIIVTSLFSALVTPNACDVSSVLSAAIGGNLSYYALESATAKETEIHEDNVIDDVSERKNQDEKSVIVSKEQKTGSKEEVLRASTPQAVHKEKNNAEVNEECKCSNAQWVTIKKATCTSEGKKILKCSECGKNIKQEVIPVLEHDWVLTKSVDATPVSEGCRIRTCQLCGKENKVTTSIELVENELWVDSAGIDVTCYDCPLSQSNVDSNEVTISSNVPSGLVLAGHNYRAFKSLHKTTIGSYIYIKRNGELRTYKVYISEPARPINNNTSLLGINSNVDLYDTSYSSDVLRLYTCFYYNFENIRWMVLAYRV